jgi:hypothetical protein
MAAAVARTILVSAIAGLVSGGLAAGCDEAATTDDPDAAVDVACDGNPPTATPLSNNGALLEGAAIGTGVDPIDALRKPLAVTVTASTDFVVGDAYATRQAASIDGVAVDGVYVVVPITNPSDELRCGITISPYRWTDVSGALVKDRGFQHVRGSVAAVPPVYSDLCLGPGESGWLLDVDNDGYEAIAGIELAFENFRTAMTSVPPARIVPRAYEVGALEDSVFRLRVDVDNEGTAAGTIRAFAVYSQAILLDDDGLPLVWTFLQDAISPEDGVIAAGASGWVEGSVGYAGCARAMHVRIGFDPAP